MSPIILTCLLSVSSAEADLLESPVEMRLDVGDSSKVVRPGDEQRAVLRLRNTSDQSAKGTVHVRVETYEGEVIEETRGVKLAAGRELRVPMPKRAFDRLEIKWVKYHWEQDGKSTDTFQAAFAYMAPTGPGGRGSDEFIFAIAFGAGPDNLSEEAARRSSLCGVAVNRANPRWPNVQPKKDVWNWEIPDRILRSRAKYGMEVQWLVS